MTRGHYSTRQKDLILSIIQSMDHEFTIREIYNSIPDTTSLTTVYRLVDQLEQEGIINKAIGSDGNTYYQYIEKCDCNHFYLKCEKCGSLTHVECDFVNDLENHILEDHKFRLNCEHIIMNGICYECARKEGIVC